MNEDPNRRHLMDAFDRAAESFILARLLEERRRHADLLKGITTEDRARLDAEVGTPAQQLQKLERENNRMERKFLRERVKHSA